MSPEYKIASPQFLTYGDTEVKQVIIGKIQEEELKQKVIEIDDIQCDLDEDLDDEHYSQQDPATGPARDQEPPRGRSNINDSFISQKMNNFATVGHRSGIPHPTTTKQAPCNRVLTGLNNSIVVTNPSAMLPPITPVGNSKPPVVSRNSNANRLPGPGGSGLPPRSSFVHLSSEKEPL